MKAERYTTSPPPSAERMEEVRSQCDACWEDVKTAMLHYPLSINIIVAGAVFVALMADNGFTRKRMISVFERAMKVAR